MKDITGKIAFVTGAASGIGLAVTQALVAKGAKVMMADIDGSGLSKAAANLDNVRTVICDVTDINSVQTAANATMDAFGGVNILFNNAGVGLGGSPGNVPIKDWRWIVDINLMGVVHGIETFVPLMRDSAEDGYIVNTASMAGHMSVPTMGPYHATKFAVVGYSECLKQELAEDNIGVSVLCPGWVQTNIHNSAAGRPTAGEGPDFRDTPLYEMTKALIEGGMTAERLAEFTLHCMAENRFYIFTDPTGKTAIEGRMKTLLEDYQLCLSELAE